MARAQFPGAGLREIRERLGLTLRDVEEKSRRIAEERQDFYYVITAGRLSQIENSNSLPSVYKLASLSAIYKLPIAELFRIYGIDMTELNREQKPEGEGEKNPANEGVVSAT